MNAPFASFARKAPADSPWMRRLEFFFRRYGGLALFILLCYGFYYRIHLQTAQELESLQQMHESLMQEKENTDRTRLELTLRWQSIQDPGWRRLILMRELGLTPKGFKKIVFISTPSEHPSLDPS